MPIQIFQSFAEIPSINLCGKNIIVTGATAGIGTEIARHLFKLGANLTLTYRNEEKAKLVKEDLLKTPVLFPGGSITLSFIDLADLDSVRTFAEDFIKTGAPLHILINNAGLISSSDAKTKQGYEMTFGANHLGPFLLTNLLLEPLKAAYRQTNQLSRVVCVSSEGNYFKRVNLDDITLSKMPFTGVKSAFDIYCVSKLMNVMFARELDRKERKNGIIALSLHPGVIRSELARDAKGVVRFIMNIVMPFVSYGTKKGSSSALFAALSPEVLENPDVYGGSFLWNDGKIRTPNKQALDDEVCGVLWTKSMEYAKL